VYSKTGSVPQVGAGCPGTGSSLIPPLRRWLNLRKVYCQTGSAVCYGHFNVNTRILYLREMFFVLYL
jgi:hypothetical protein